MAKQDHVEAAKRGFGAFNSRDPEQMVAVCAPDVEFTSLINEADGRVYRGHEGIREFFADQNEVFARLVATVEAVESKGEVAVITGRIEGEARGSGMTLDIRFVQLATLRNGLLMAWRFFRTREEALTALAAGSMRNADA